MFQWRLLNEECNFGHCSILVNCNEKSSFNYGFAVHLRKVSPNTNRIAVLKEDVVLNLCILVYYRNDLHEM